MGMLISYPYLLSSLIIRKICLTGSKKKKNAKPLSFKVGIGKVIRGVSRTGHEPVYILAHAACGMT